MVIALGILIPISMFWYFSYSQEPNPLCQGNARCYTGKVTSVIDGDTIKIGLTSIRLALVNTPELNQIEGKKSKEFTENFCPVDSDVLIDEDDGQTSGSYGRILAEVFCSGKSLNEALLENKLGIIDTRFCSESEFADKDWAINFGC